MSDIKALIDGLESRLSRRMDERLAEVQSQQPEPLPTPSSVTTAASTMRTTEESKDHMTVKPVSMSQQRQRVLTERAERVMATAQSANKDILGAPTPFLAHMATLLDPHQPPTADADLDQDAYDGENMSEVGGGRAGQGKVGAGFHPDLFRTDTMGRPDVIRMLGTALSSASKTTTKFKSIDQMYEVFHAQVQLIRSEGTDVPHRLTQWMRYERHVLKLVMDKGLEAASKYHFDLFSRVRAGEHDLWLDGYYNPQVMRDVDVAYPSKSFQGSKGKDSRPSSNYKSGGSNKFSGEPCKHHGPNAKHTTSECKDPELKNSRK